VRRSALTARATATVVAAFLCRTIRYALACAFYAVQPIAADLAQSTGRATSVSSVAGHARSVVHAAPFAIIGTAPTDTVTIDALGVVDARLREQRLVAGRVVHDFGADPDVVLNAV